MKNLFFYGVAAPRNPVVPANRLNYTAILQFPSASSLQAQTGSKLKLATAVLMGVASLGLVLTSGTANAELKNFTRIYSTRYQKIENSSFTMASNSIVTNTKTATVSDIDTSPDTFNSSSAALSLPDGAEVTAAYLVVQGTIEAGAADNPAARHFLFRGPGFDYVDVDEGNYDVRSFKTYYAGAVGYQAFADVTKYVKTAGKGAYMVANVHHDSRKNYLSAAGWSLIVLYKGPNEPCRQLTLIDGWSGFAGPGYPITAGSGSQSNYDETIFVLRNMRSPSWPGNQVNASVGYVALGGSRTNLNGVWEDHWHLRNWWGGYPHPGDGANETYDYFNGTTTIFGREQLGRIPSGYTGKDFRGYDRMSPNFDAEIMGVDPVNGYPSGINGNSDLWPMVVNDEIQIGLWVLSIDQDPALCPGQPTRAFDDQLAMWSTNGLDPTKNDNLPSGWSMRSFTQTSKAGRPITKSGNWLYYNNKIAATDLPNSDSFEYTVCDQVGANCQTATVRVAANAHGKVAEQGFSQNGAISGRVWNDNNGDGIKARNAYAGPMATARLLDASGQLVAGPIKTWNDAGYLFSEVGAGNYLVELAYNCGAELSPVGQGTFYNDNNFKFDRKDGDTCYAKADMVLAARQFAHSVDLGLVNTSQEAPDPTIPEVNPVSGTEPVPQLTPPTTPPTSAQSLSTSSDTYQAGEAIQVSWNTAALGSQSWVGIFKSDAINTAYLDWAYTGGKASGTLSFNNSLQPGTYQARLFKDNGYELLGSSNNFIVKSVSTGGGTTGGSSDGSTGPVISTKNGPTYATGQPIIIEWSGASSNAQAWVGVFTSGAADTSYGEWSYTGGAVSGQYQLTKALPAGSYEVRLFKDNGYTRLSAWPFKVTN